MIPCKAKSSNNALIPTHRTSFQAAQHTFSKRQGNEIILEHPFKIFSNLFLSIRIVRDFINDIT